MARAVHAWQIADGLGVPIAELTTAAGRQITYQRNSYTEAQYVVSHEDDSAALLLEALAFGIPQLRVYRFSPGATTADLIFRGWLAPFQEDADEQAQLSAVFRSPFARLTGDGSDRGRFTDEVFERFATDAGQIAVDLIDFANDQGATGLITTGSITPTVPRDRAYQYANIGESIVQLTQISDGGDFSETFLEDSALAEFNWHESLGDDRPAARFEYGEETLSNVRSMSRTTQAPINSVRILGANGLVGSASDVGSIATYGLYPLQASASDIDVQAVLDDRATTLLRIAPVKTVEFTPEYGLPNCPQPFDDFFIGDTVQFYARRAALEESTAVRVNGMTLTVDENGYEVADIPDPLTPGEEATIRANLSLEVVDDG